MIHHDCCFVQVNFHKKKSTLPSVAVLLIPILSCLPNLHQPPRSFSLNSLNTIEVHRIKYSSVGIAGSNFTAMQNPFSFPAINNCAHIIYNSFFWYHTDLADSPNPSPLLISSHMNPTVLESPPLYFDAAYHNYFLILKYLENWKARTQHSERSKKTHQPNATHLHSWTATEFLCPLTTVTVVKRWPYLSVHSYKQPPIGLFFQQIILL